MKSIQSVFFLFLLLLGATVNAQVRSVSGTVKDAATGDGLPGVNILIKGSNTGVSTDFDGNYSIEVSNDAATLEFTFLGFKRKSVVVGSQTVIDILLEEDASQLDEIIVVGYGSIRKADATGSISTVTSDDLSAFPSPGVAQALQGRASGVVVQAVNPEPGGAMKVRIRGGTSINASSDPLYVVDGFPGGAIPAPEEIASMEVLKDASSTAIYGSRGSNGVIIITTKKGKTGALKIDLNMSTSFSEVINTMDLLDKDQYTDLFNEINGTNDPAPAVGTDWQGEIFQTGAIQNYQLSLSGGSENVTYYVSGVYYDQEGVVINSNFKRFSITSNLNIKASDNLDFGINIMARRADKQGVRSQEGTGGGNAGGPVGRAFAIEPTLPVFDDDGNYTISSNGDPSDNAVALANELTDDILDDIMQANFFLKWDIIEDLTFQSNWGANTRNRRRGRYTPSSLLQGVAVGGDGRIEGSKYTSLLTENYLTYRFVTENNNHNLTAMAGYSYQSTSSEYWSAHGQSFLTDSGYYWGLSGASVFQAPAANLSETVLSSFYGRVNYKLFNRFIFTFNARYDGSSRFAKNEKWAFFPSGAFGWNIKDESFMSDVELVSQLKLRASYGVTGSQAISPYQSLAELSFVHSIVNSNIVNAVRPTAVANDNLTWESTTQSDIGIEIGFLNQRIVLVADFYNKQTDDLIFSQPLPPHSGYTSFLNNIGSVQNRGTDLTLSTVNFKGEFRWTSDINFSINKNEVLELPDGNDIRYGASPGHMVGTETTSLLRVGEPVGVFYGYVYDGVYQEGEAILPGNFDQFGPGSEKMKDINGDSEISAADRTIIGDPNADFFWGFNNNFFYKNFDMNLFFVGSQGNDIYSFTLEELGTMRGIANSTTEALNRWTPTNTNTNVPAANINRGYHSTSRWVSDGSYVRLRNIAVGYTFPKSGSVEKIRLYVSGQNVLTFTDYQGFDPEVNYGSDNNVASGNLRQGLDYASYPNSKSFTLGLNITF